METDWAGTYVFRAPVVRPTDVEAVRTAVREATHVRALGTRHTFNGLAESPGVLLDLTALPDDVQVRDDGTVSVTAGTTYGALARELHRHGRGLHNLGSLPHISVGGAVATGTHGSGDALGVLATAVREVELVDADGELRTVRRDDADGAGLLVALGSVGVVVRLVLETQPTYEVRQDVYRGLDWEVLLADVAAVTDAAYSVSVFTDWLSPTIDQVWVKRRVASVDEAVPDELAGARRSGSAVQIIESAEDNTTQQGVAGAWSAHLPHFRIDSTPSKGDEIQTEYFVGKADAADALRAVRALAEEIHPHLLVTELRTIAADRLWLSEASERESLAIHFTFKNEPAAVQALCTRIEAALAPFAPRPHWGKVHTVDAAAIADRYPRLPDFQALRAEADPQGKFGGPALDALIGAVRA